MRKKVVIAGITCLVIGALLFLYGFYSTFWLTMQDTTKTIPSDKFYMLNMPGVESGMKVHSEYTASNEVRFYILDESNYNKFEMFLSDGTLTFFQFVYHSEGESESHTFRAPKDDTYYIVLCGDNDVSVTVKILTERIWINGMIYFIALFLFVPIGFIVLIVGLVQKPKTAKPPKITEYNEASLMREKQTD